MSNKWSAPTSPDEAARRAGGRRRYHALRQFQASYRRARVAHLLRRYGMGWGSQARLAAALGVSRATISRDMAVLLHQVAPCPCCGSFPRLGGELAALAEAAPDEGRVGSG